MGPAVIGIVEFVSGPCDFGAALVVTLVVGASGGAVTWF